MSAIRLSISNTNTFTLWGLAFHQVLKNGIIVSSRHWEISENGKKWGFGASRKVEIQKNNVSGCPDEWFFVKMSRRGVPKPQNLKK